jgi:hypothetical protein
MIAKISDSLIPTLPPAIQKPYEVCDTDISGFRLMVRPSGVKSFIYKYTSPITGNRYTATLGKYGTITATRARKKAKLEAAKVTLGKDIQLDEKEKRKNNNIKQLQTLGVFFHAHYVNNLSMKKNGHKIIKHLEVTFVNQWQEKQLSTINRELIDKWRSKRIKQGVKPSTICRPDVVSAIYEYIFQKIAFDESNYSDLSKTQKQQWKKWMQTNYENMASELNDEEYCIDAYSSIPKIITYLREDIAHKQMSDFEENLDMEATLEKLLGLHCAAEIEIKNDGTYIVIPFDATPKKTRKPKVAPNKDMES